MKNINYRIERRKINTKNNLYFVTDGVVFISIKIVTSALFLIVKSSFWMFENNTFKIFFWLFLLMG
jgi:predicted RNA-binding protein associated with RNAse of E/G family